MATTKTVEVRSRVPVLYASFGLSQAGATAVDTLILLFAAKVLYAPQRDIAAIDAAGTIAYTLAAIGFGLLWHQAPSKRIYTALGFVSIAIPIFLFSSIGTLWMAYTLATLFGALTVLPNALTAGYLSEIHPRAQLGSVYGKLGASGSLGSALGLLLAIGWLTVATHFEATSVAERSLFVVLGLLTVLSGLGAWYATVGMRVGQGQPVAVKAWRSPLSLVWNWLQSRPRPPAQPGLKAVAEPVMSEAMVTFLLLTCFLYVGVGMSFTGILLYIIGDLNVSTSIALLAVLVFRIGASLVSTPAGNHMNQVMPLRFQQIAGSWRILAMVVIGLVSLLPIGVWGLSVILPLIALSGVSGGIMGVTGPVTAAAIVSTPKQPLAYLLFIAASNGGAGVGAWLASLAAPSLGFAALLGISALMMGTVLLVWHRV